MKNTMIKLLDENDVIMIDTCFAMRDEFPNFVEAAEFELLVRRKKIVVKSVVMAELYRHLNSEDEILRTKATRAVDTICMHRNVFDIDDCNISSKQVLSAFADAEFISDFSQRRLSNRMALLTNDYNLGKDINDLNNLGSCMGKKIEVYALNKKGNLEERFFDEPKTEKIIEKVVKVPEVDTEKTTNWGSIIVSSVISAATGALLSKYGKDIIKSISKAIA